MASDIINSDQTMQKGGLAEMFVSADAAIERRRTDNIFRQLDERSLTEEEERIIQQRVQLQRKLLVEYEKREQKRKVTELQDMWPELTEAAALRALELCNGKEDDAVFRLTEDAVFKRRVMAETGTFTPITVVAPTKGSTSRGCSGRSKPARLCGGPTRISPSKLEGKVFVGRFRSKLGPYQEQALADAAAAQAAAVAAATGQPQPKKRGRPKKHKGPTAADPTVLPTAASAVQSEDLSRAAALGAARAAACAEAADIAPDALPGHTRERSSSPSDTEHEADIEAAEAAGVAVVDAGEASPGPGVEVFTPGETTPGSAPMTTATNTDCAGTDTDGPGPSSRKQRGQESQAAAVERVASMMARQIARLEPLVAAGRLLDFELRRPGASQAVLDILATEYGAEVSQPIATAWEVLLEEQKWKEAEELAAYEASKANSKSSSRQAATTSTPSQQQAAVAAPASCPEPQQQQPSEQQVLEGQQPTMHVAGTADVAAALAAAAALTTDASATHTVQYCGCGCGLPLDQATLAVQQGHLAVATAAMDPAAMAAAPVAVLPSVVQQYRSWSQDQPFQQQRQQWQQGYQQRQHQQQLLPVQEAPIVDLLMQQQQQQQQVGWQPSSSTVDIATIPAAAHETPAAVAEDDASDASTTTEPTASPAKTAAVAAASSGAEAGSVQEQQQQQQEQQIQRRSKRAAAVTAVSSAAAAAAAGSDSSSHGRAAASVSARAQRAISETGHTCRGRVRQKSHKTTELVEVGTLMPNPHWFNAGYIFPAGFKSRLLFRSSVDIDALCLHECEIVGEGGKFWPAPTFVVTARDREDEPMVAKSCTGCWSGILKRINAVITQRRAQGEALPPPPRTAIAGPEYFGLNDDATIAAIEALDPQHLCTTYWIGKEQREAAAAGMPITVQASARSSKGGRGSGGGAAGGRKRGRSRADAADADDEGEEMLGYKGSKWSSISRRERYIKRCTDAGDEAPVSDDQQLLPGVLDPITLEPVVNPAISPAGHVMGLATWKAVLAENARCPFTKAPLRPDQLVVLTVNNLERYRDRIITMS